jgi:TRAP-type C4-dicarboxylate transport system permease small subunit
MRLPTLIAGLARWLALVGGLVLLAVTVMTCISIAGRALMGLGFSPVPGDYEIAEAAIGFVVFSFLPWCQLNRGHATVDLFTSFLPASANRVIDLVSEILMAIATVVIAWRLWFGMVDKINYGETTFILEMPVLWAYALCMAAAAGAVIVALYMIVVRACEVAVGRSLLAPRQGGMH